MKRILVFRNDRLGDLTVTTAALKALRKALPQAEIAFVCSSYNARLAKELEGISQIFIWDRKASFIEKLKTFFKLRQFKADVAFIFSPLKVNYWIAYFLQTPVRAGLRLISTKRERPAPFFRKLLLTYDEILDQRETPDPELVQHQVLAMLKLVEKGTGQKVDLETPLFLPTYVKEQEKVRTLVGEGPYILFHLDARLFQEGWQEEDVASLLKELQGLNKKIIVTGSAPIGSKKDYFDQKVANASQSGYELFRAYKMEGDAFVPLNTAEKEKPLFVEAPDLAYWCAFISLSGLVISRDSACVHLAAAYQKPVVDLFHEEGLSHLQEIWHPWQVPYKYLKYGKKGVPIPEIITSVQELLDF